MSGIQPRYKTIIKKMAALEAAKGVHLTDEQREKIARFMIDEVGKAYITPKQMVEKIEAKEDNISQESNAEIEKKYGAFYIKDKAKRAKRKQAYMIMKKLLLDDELQDQRKTEKYFEGNDTDRKVLVYFKPTENCEEAERIENERYNRDLSIYFAPDKNTALRRYKSAYQDGLSDEAILERIKENHSALLMQTYKDNEEQMMKFGETLHISTDPEVFINNFKTVNFLTALTAEAENILSHKAQYNLGEGDKLLLEKYKRYSNVFAVAQKTMECMAGPEYEYIDLNTIAHCKEHLFDETFRDDPDVADEICAMHDAAYNNLCDHPDKTFLMNGRNDIMLHSDKAGMGDIKMKDFVRELGVRVSTNDYSTYDTLGDFHENLEILINNKNNDCNFRYLDDLVRFGFKAKGEVGEADHREEWNEPVVHEANGRTVVFCSVNNSYTYKAPEMLYNDSLKSMGKELVDKLNKAESMLADINDSFWKKNEFKEIKRDLNNVYKLGYLKKGADATEYVEALSKLSASCKKYLTRKAGEHVDTPSQRRQNRVDFVQLVSAFAETKMNELNTVLRARDTLVELRKETENVLLTAILNNLKADRKVYGEPINFNGETVERELGADVIKDCIREGAAVKEVFAKLKDDDEIIYRSKDVNFVRRLSYSLFDMDRGFAEAYKTALRNKAAERAVNNPEAGDNAAANNAVAGNNAAVNNVAANNEAVNNVAANNVEAPAANNAAVNNAVAGNNVAANNNVANNVAANNPAANENRQNFKPEVNRFKADRVPGFKLRAK